MIAIIHSCHSGTRWDERGLYCFAAEWLLWWGEGWWNRQCAVL